MSQAEFLRTDVQERSLIEGLAQHSIHLAKTGSGLDKLAACSEGWQKARIKSVSHLIGCRLDEIGLLSDCQNLAHLVTGLAMLAYVPDIRTHEYACGVNILRLADQDIRQCYEAHPYGVSSDMMGAALATFILRYGFDSNRANFAATRVLGYPMPGVTSKNHKQRSWRECSDVSRHSVARMAELQALAVQAALGGASHEPVFKAQEKLQKARVKEMAAYAMEKAGMPFNAKTVGQVDTVKAFIVNGLEVMRASERDQLPDAAILADLKANDRKLGEGAYAGWPLRYAARQSLRELSGFSRINFVDLLWHLPRELELPRQSIGNAIRSRLGLRPVLDAPQRVEPLDFIYGRFPGAPYIG